MAAPTPQAANDNMSPQLTRLQILMALQGAPGGAFAGLTDTQLRATPVPVSLGSYPSGTLAIFAKTAGETATIPVGAFQIGIVFLTGTGTIGGVDWPVGIPFNIEARTAATIAVVCGSPGTARVQYLA